MQRLIEILKALAELTHHEAFQKAAQDAEAHQGGLASFAKGLAIAPPQSLKVKDEDADSYNRLVSELNILTGASKVMSVSSSAK